MRSVITILILITFVIACAAWVSGETDSKIIGTPLAFTVPKGWPKPVYDFKNNRLTKEGVELGRKLFYDGRLSKDGNISCGSCHQQFAAFSTYDHNLSHGVNNA